VLLVNELPVLVEALAQVLSNQKQITIIGANRSSELLILDPARLPQTVESLRPNVVLINCTRGDLDWTGTISEIHDRSPSVKVAVVVMRSDPETLRPYIDARAVGCVTADVPLAEYLKAIRRIHQGEVLFPADALLHLLTAGRRARSDPQGISTSTAVLGPREREVLEALAMGLSTGQAAERLGITVHTVRTHLKNVLGKLHAHSKLDAVLIALRSGMIRLPGRTEASAYSVDPIA
jgi:DNA-binding NarL/FixJ family response regulator